MHACVCVWAHLVVVSLGHVRAGQRCLHHCLPRMLLLRLWLMLMLLQVMQTRGLLHCQCQAGCRHGAREHCSACGTARAY